MTREEKKAIDGNKYYPDDVNGYYAFLQGAEWSDKHPKNVWHDASEEPRYNKLMLGMDSDGVSLYKWCGQEDSWNAFCDINNLVKWAYISDLLPKGDER